MTLHHQQKQGQKKRVLITGGAGFIGSRLAKNLSRSSKVSVFDNLHPQAHQGNPENLARLEAAKISLHRGDIRDSVALKAAIDEEQPEIIYHLAAETGTGQSFDLPGRYTDVNVMGTVHLIEAIRNSPNVKRVILAGSRSVYGEGSYINDKGILTPALERIDENMILGDFAPKDVNGTTLRPVATDARCSVAPASIYASTKLMQEYLLRQAFWGSSTKVGILRLQNVYGPGQSLNNPYTGVLSIFCRQIQEGKTLNIYEDGEITRDFVLVDDVVDAFIRMGTNLKMPEEIIDIGSGQKATILTVAQDLLRLFNEDLNKLKITGAYRPGDIRYALADIRKAQDLLGWAPKTQLSDGLSALVDWSRTPNAQKAA